MMGCYGIGIGRTVAAAIEQNHDENGIIWPMPHRPFPGAGHPAQPERCAGGRGRRRALRAAAGAGVEVLLDDRDERPGSKFKDADLLGIPLRVTVGARGLKEGALELQERRGGERPCCRWPSAAAEVAALVRQDPAGRGLNVPPEGSNTPMSQFSIDSHGRLPLPAPLVRAFAGRPLQQVSVTDRHLLLGVDDGKGELTLAGALGDISVTDLLSFFNMFRKTGILRFRFPGGSRDLYFQNGEIVFATSTFPEEGIGEILCDLGQLERAVLEKLRQVSAGKGGLGRLLVEKGAVTAKDLWLATRQQVEAIVYHLFGAQDGSFAFFAKPLAEEEIVRLSMSTQNLIMEGLRRIDERGLFLRRIGSLDLLVVLVAAVPEGLTPTEERLLRLVAAAPGTVRELVRRSGLGEYSALRLVYQLLERGGDSARGAGDGGSGRRSR